MSETKVFLSYSRKDSVVAKKLAKDIMSKGGNIWMDQLNIKSGMRWDRAIEKALDESSHLMILLTSSSVDSDNVMDEVSYALDENKTIITALLDNCKVPFRLRRFQHIDFTNNYQDGLEEILHTINISVVGNVPPPKKSKPVSKAKTEIKSKEIVADIGIQCPHCNEKIVAKDSSYVECTECNKLFFEDERDGNIYKIVKIGDQIWMAENLKFETNEGSVCYDDKEENCNIYGKLYNWNTAMKVSPKGWHLSSDKEWQELIGYCGGESVAGKNLKSSYGWNENGNGVDKYNFSILPGGCHLTDGRFWSIGESSNLWTTLEGKSDNALGRILNDYKDEVSSNYYSKGQKCSVRCLRDF